MKFILPVLIMSAFLFSCGRSNLHTAFSGSRYIVYTKSLIKSHVDLKKVIDNNGGRIFKKLKYGTGYVAYFKNPIMNLKNFDKNIRIERDVIFKASIGSCSSDPIPKEPNPEQPIQKIDWGVKRLNADKAWQYSTGKGVLVCVVDTGIDTNHPDLKDNIKGGAGFVNNSDSYYDNNEHGSHVSGIIAAVNNSIGIVGAAHEAKIWAVKVLGSDGSGWSSDIANGIENCIANGADIINMSLGSSGSSKIIHDAVIKAYKAGIIIVAAAGNESTSVGYPAAHPEVIAVSSLNSRDELSGFSNFGPEVEYIAPGSYINSTVPGGNYAIFSGTSMASPYVAAMFALVLSVNKADPKAFDIGLDPYKQGKGLIDALESVK